MSYSLHSSVFFFFNDTATTEIYTLSLHDALPISTDRISPFRTSRALSKLFTVGQTWRGSRQRKSPTRGPEAPPATAKGRCSSLDRKSTRLNSSHSQNSYAVFCLKKKKNTMTPVYS